jgi:hypothetical protein
MYRLLRSDALAHKNKSNCLAPLSARFLDCIAGIHSELEPEVKMSLTKSWIVASHRPAEHTRASNEHKLSRHLRGVSRGTQGGHYTVCS